MERINLTDKEKFAHMIMGNDADYTRFSMNEDNIEKMIEDDKKARFNDQVAKHEEELEKQKQAIEEYQKDLQDNIVKAEIKPLFNRILVKPFVYNPFQRIQIENGIITDIGGMNPNTEFNNQTGQWEEREQNIVVGIVVEAGPECKYLKEGDTVFYMRNMPTPVPFFKQGLWTIKEDNIIAVVNEGLEDRFNAIKNGR